MRISALAVTALCSVVALAAPSAPQRVTGASSVVPIQGGGLVTLGGESLRVLEPGGRTLQTLLRQEKKNLYRVAVSDDGRVLATWESDPWLHFFAPAPRQEVRLAQPAPPSAEVRGFEVDRLAFLPGDRQALVLMKGSVLKRASVEAAYRVPLDGSVIPPPLFTIEGGDKLFFDERVALYLAPRNPSLRCDAHGCPGPAALVAFELGGDRAVRRTLFDGGGAVLSAARVLPGPGDGRMTIVLKVAEGFVLLRWRPGDLKPEILPLPKAIGEQKLFALPSGAILGTSLRDEEELVLTRYLPGKAPEELLALRAPPDPDALDFEVHGIGLRRNGQLWLHWGDTLLLFSDDLSKRPRAERIGPLLGRRDEWAGLDRYVAEPESLWIGIEVGAYRDFVRLPFDEVDRRARRWAFEASN